jgi:hemerythrin-like domain-containing protein
MPHESLRIIREEHASLSVMLRSLAALVERGLGNPPSDYFTALRAIFSCIDEFHEAQHHPKESELLFPKVATASQDVADAVLLLDQDHATSEASARDLQHLLLEWEMIGSTRRATFESACRAYIAHLMEHMALEERLILPQAELCLSAEDWQRLDDAFALCGDARVSKYLADSNDAGLSARIRRSAGAPSVP